MRETMHVFVTGRPVTQGSKDGFVRGGRAVLVDANKATLKPWREACRSTLIDAQPKVWAPYAGPVKVTLRFFLRRPASAPKRRRTRPIKTRSGDIDKLARAVLDAATDAGVWVDDSQVVHLDAEKDWTPDDGPPGCLIIIEPVGDDQ